jgi:hypothetical protein
MDLLSPLVESPIYYSTNFLTHTQDNVLARQILPRIDSQSKQRAKTVCDSSNSNVVERPSSICSIQKRQGCSNQIVVLHCSVSQTLSGSNHTPSDFPMHKGSYQNATNRVQPRNGSMENGASSWRIPACMGNGTRSFVCASWQNISHRRF